MGNRLLALLAAMGGFLAAIFSLRSRVHKERAKRHENNADRASALNDTSRRTDQLRTEVKERHREEERDGQARLNAGDRSHLDNDW